MQFTQLQTKSKAKFVSAIPSNQSLKISARKQSAPEKIFSLLFVDDPLWNEIFLSILFLRRWIPFWRYFLLAFATNPFPFAPSSFSLSFINALWAFRIYFQGKSVQLIHLFHNHFWTYERHFLSFSSFHCQIFCHSPFPRHYIIPTKEKYTLTHFIYIVLRRHFRLR